MRVTKEEIYTIPNLLSLFRLLLIPVFIIQYINAQTTLDYLIAALIVFVSSLTDLLDGFIARRFHQITELGKLLDPIADKLTHISIAVCLMFSIRWMFLIVILLLIKELFMGIAGLIILKKKGRKLGGAKWFGKFSTFIVDTSMFFLLFVPSLSLFWTDVLLFFIGGVLLFSFVMYIPVFIHMYRDNEKNS